jgi:hypothetical protein
MTIEIRARNEENTASLNISRQISLSESGPSANINLNSVIGAFLSFDAINLKSSIRSVGRDFTFLCSTIFLTLARKRKEFITAGNKAITAINSELPAIAIDPYIAPINKVPESPGNILLGNL